MMMALGANIVTLWMLVGLGEIFKAGRDWMTVGMFEQVLEWVGGTTVWSVDECLECHLYGQQGRVGEVDCDCVVARR